MITWSETTEDKFRYMLEILPPASNVPGFGAFQVGEAYDHINGRPSFRSFCKRGRKYYVSNEAATFSDFKKEFPQAKYYYVE